MSLMGKSFKKYGEKLYLKENAKIPPSIRYFKLNTATDKHKK